MRMSRMLGRTLRQVPAGSEVAGHQLLLRAGALRQLTQGVFSYLPAGLRSIRRIEGIVREEMEAAGGVEISMPVVHPAELWRTSGRLSSIGPELTRFADRRQRELVLAMTHEEVVASLAATEVASWRDLPRLVYQVQTKFRDDPRPRAGLIRAREFTMKDAYSLDRDAAGLDEQYRRMQRAYERIFARCGLPVLAVGADVGMMGGSGAHEFMYLTPIGEDTLVLCDACGYAQNRQVATFAKPAPPAADARPVERVQTPGAETIARLVEQLGVDAAETGKVVFVAATVPDTTEQPIVAVVRGDMNLNETKLANVVGARGLRPMTGEEIVSIGCVAGYASPIGVGGRATVVVDDLAAASPGLVMGANEAGWHLRHVAAGRDYEPDLVADIVAADDGHGCPTCAAPLRTSRGVEVGNIFKLGTRYSEALGATFLDADGTERPVVMGSYGIGIGRLLACIAEEHHDDRGLRWPAAVAPFDVHLCALGSENLELAGALHDEGEAAGLDVLLDDRSERPGVQFADADLIGAPVRITVSTRSVEAGGVEATLRGGAEREIVAVGDAIAWVGEQLTRLRAPDA
jgi:prolyl-tRNA synthetase